MTDTPLLSSRAWEELRQWYRDHGRHDLPWRSDRTPWRVLLAENVLHRTRADIASRLYPTLIGEFPSPHSILDAPERWTEAMRPAGLAWRAHRFLDAVEVLVAEHGGNVPGNVQDLLALPGVGHYIAGAVVCFGFGQPAVIVDTNTIRVAARVAGANLDPTRHRSQHVRSFVERLGPEGRPPSPDENFALLDLAALVCTSSKPRCDQCPLLRECSFGQNRIGSPE